MSGKTYILARVKSVWIYYTSDFEIVYKKLF